MRSSVSQDERQRQRIAHLERENRRLKKQSRTDPLTGLANRRYFCERLDAEFARCKRTLHPLTVGIADIDRFKKINDTQGHSGGDLVLKRLALTLKKRLRRSDFLCRYGGEEFALLLPDTGTGATNLAEDLCEAVADLDFPWGVVTISIGLATSYAEEGELADDLIEAADRAMYRAKERRNAVYSVLS